MQGKKGFTLIEVLVVLVIIGITLGFAMLSFGDFGRARRLVTQSESIFAEFKSIQQQAMLESATYGLQITPQGYQIMRFDSLKNWQPATSVFLIKPHPFPKGATVQFESSQNKKKPSVIIYSTGELTPFRLSFGTSKNLYFVQIIGEESGRLTFKSELAQ